MDKSLSTPIAIVVAGALIAIAVFFVGGGVSTEDGYNKSGSEFNNNGSDTASSIRPVNENDHIFGNPDAKVTIIEFSDYECPYCASFHPTLEKIVEDFDGEVNWAYRHFPLSSIHSQAVNSAISAECVAKLAGNDAFWSFSKTLFNNQKNLNNALYTNEAVALGVDDGEFASCVIDAAVAARVEAEFNEAIEAGGRGTPFSVVISADGEFFPFSGALPYEQVKAVLEKALVN